MPSTVEVTDAVEAQSDFSIVANWLPIASRVQNSSEESDQPTTQEPLNPIEHLPPYKSTGWGPCLAAGIVTYSLSKSVKLHDIADEINAARAIHAQLEQIHPDVVCGSVYFKETRMEFSWPSPVRPPSTLVLQGQALKLMGVSSINHRKEITVVITKVPEYDTEAVVHGLSRALRPHEVLDVWRADAQYTLPNTGRLQSNFTGELFLLVRLNASESEMYLRNVAATLPGWARGGRGPPYKLKNAHRAKDHCTRCKSTRCGTPHTYMNCPTRW